MRWIVAVIIAILAIILGNIYILKLPWHTKAFFYRIQFFTIIQVVLFCGSYIIWQTLKSAMQRTRSSIRKTCLSLLAVYLFISQTCLFSALFLIGTNPHWYSVFSFICFGLYTQLIFAVLTLKGFFLILRGIGKIGLIKLHQRKAQGPDQCSQDFIPSRLGRVSLLVIFIYSVVMGLYGVHQAWKPPTVAMVNLTLPKFPPSLNGLKVLQLADIHLGETVGRNRMSEIVKISQELQPGKCQNKMDNHRLLVSEGGIQVTSASILTS